MGVASMPRSFHIVKVGSAVLLRRRVQLEPGRQARQRLLQYLNKAAPKQRALIVEKNGWVEKANKFVPFDLGGLDGCSEYLCSRFPVASKLFEQRGTLEEWKKHVGVYCKGNPLLQAVTVAALSGPLLAFMGHSGFGIHLYGNSSSGKTTSLHIAGSVTGGELKSWRTTDNGLEGIARTNEQLPFADEISQCDPDVVARWPICLPMDKVNHVPQDRGQPSRAEWILTFLSQVKCPYLTVPTRVMK